MTNVLQSQFNCRINNIDSIISKILSQRYYKLTMFQLNLIRNNYPTKKIPEYLDLTDIHQVWFLLGPNVRLYKDEFLTLKKSLNTLKTLIDEIIIFSSEIWTEVNYYRNGSLEINFYILDFLSKSYSTLLEKYENIYVTIDEILRSCFIFKSYLDFPNNINNLNNEYTKKLSIDWFYNLFFIYEKYQGSYPVTCNNLFEFFKKHYTNMESIHQEEIVSIIDTYLGGLSTSEISNISKNFESWIKRNYDCVGNFIINKLQFVNIVEAI